MPKYYHHLTQEQRCQIAALKTIGMSNRTIAKKLIFLDPARVEQHLIDYRFVMRNYRELLAVLDESVEEYARRDEATLAAQEKRARDTAALQKNAAAEVEAKFCGERRAAMLARRNDQRSTVACFNVGRSPQQKAGQRPRKDKRA